MEVCQQSPQQQSSPQTDDEIVVAMKGDGETNLYKNIYKI